MKLSFLAIGLILVIAAFVTYGLIGYSTVIWGSSGTPSISIVGWSTAASNPLLVPSIAAGAVLNYVLTINNIAPNTITSIATMVNGYPSGNLIVSGSMTYGAAVNSSAVYYSYSYSGGLSSGLEYQITCTVASSLQGTFTVVYYIQAQALQGYFTINGQQVNSSSVVQVTNPTLTFTFVDTTQPLLSPILVKPTVTIYNGPTLLATLTPTGVSSTFTFPTFTLPTYGTYTVMGTVAYGGQTLTLMSTLAGFGNNASINAFGILEITMGVLGVALLAMGFILPSKRVSR